MVVVGQRQSKKPFQHLIFIGAEDEQLPQQLLSLKDHSFVQVKICQAQFSLPLKGIELPLCRGVTL